MATTGGKGMYGRDGGIRPDAATASMGLPADDAAAVSAQGENDPNRIPINGFQQVLDMLRIADPAFRESLLKRLGARDRMMAVKLRRALEDS